MREYQVNNWVIFYPDCYPTFGKIISVHEGVYKIETAIAQYDLTSDRIKDKLNIPDGNIGKEVLRIYLLTIDDARCAIAHVSREVLEAALRFEKERQSPSVTKIKMIERRLKALDKGAATPEP